MIGDNRVRGLNFVSSVILISIFAILLFFLLKPSYEAEVIPVSMEYNIEKFTFTVYHPDKASKCLRNEECRILAEAIYFEARGESLIGQQAVGHVILNRVSSPYFPDTVKEVIKYRCHFSYRCDGSLERGIHEKNAWNRSLKIAKDVLFGKIDDPTNGADHYANPSKVKRIPRWMRVYETVAVIDQHHFYRR